MCLKFPDFEAGRAYELGAYKKKRVHIVKIWGGPKKSKFCSRPAGEVRFLA